MIAFIVHRRHVEHEVTADRFLGFSKRPGGGRYVAWCREQGVPWRGDDRDYGCRGTGDRPLIADDADVAVIAGHATRMALDALTRSEASRFPHPAYVIGLSAEWIFSAQFDTRPIDFLEDGAWAGEASPERTVDALGLMTSLFEQV